MINIDSVDSNRSKSSRKRTIQKYKGVCCYCGRKYEKYIRYIKLNGKDEICCPICFGVTHINFGFCKEFELYYSHLTQLEIVQKTVDYIALNGVNPTPNSIDPNCEKVDLSLLEFTNTLIFFNGLPKELGDMKLFITQDFDTSFVEFNQFSDPCPCEVNDIPVRSLSNTELEIVKKGCLSVSSTN